MPEWVTTRPSVVPVTTSVAARGGSASSRPEQSFVDALQAVTPAPKPGVVAPVVARLPTEKPPPPAGPLPRSKPVLTTDSFASNQPLPQPKPVVPELTARESTSLAAATPLPREKPRVPPAADPRREITEAVRSVSRLSGISAHELVAKAAMESGFNPMAKSRTSSAAGPFQFIASTWLDLVRRHGSAYGLGEQAAAIEVRKGVSFVRDPELRKQILDLRHDVNLSAGMAARYLGEVGKTLGQALHRDATPAERRLAYVLGPAGAASLIKAATGNPHGSAVDLLPQAARANRSLFFADGQALTNSAALARITRFTERQLSQHMPTPEDRRITSDQIALSDQLG